MKFPTGDTEEEWRRHPYSQALLRACRDESVTAIKTLVGAAMTSTDPKVVRIAYEYQKLVDLVGLLEGRHSGRSDPKTG